MTAPELKGCEDESTEVILDGKQCAEIAMYMYRNWQEAMKPPLFAFIQFPDWLVKMGAER